MVARRIPTTVLLTQEQRAAIERVRKRMPIEASLGDVVRLLLDRGVVAYETPAVPRIAA